MKPLNDQNDTSLSEVNIKGIISSSGSSSNDNRFEKVVGLEGVIIQICGDENGFYALNSVGEVFTWNIIKGKNLDENKMDVNNSN